MLLPQKKYRIALLVVIGAVLLFLPLLWFLHHPGYILAYGDSDLPLSTKTALARSFFLWNDHNASGFDQTSFVPKMIFTFVFYVLNLIFNLQITQVLFFGLIFLTSFFSFKYLSSYILRERMSGSTFYAVITGSIFYALNNYVLIRMIDGHYPYMWLYALLPFLLKNFIEILESGRKKSYYLLALGFALVGPIFIPHIFFAFASIFFLYLVVYIFDHKDQLLSIIKKSCAVFLLFFLINAVFIFPSFVYFLNLKNVDSLKPENAVNAISWGEGTRDLLNSLRGLADAGLVKGWQGIAFYSFGHTYIYNDLYIVFSFLFILLIVFFLPFEKKYIKNLSNVLKLNYVYFLVLFLVGVFIVKADAPPFGGLYIWAINNIPLFWYLRSPEAKFNILVYMGLAFLLVLFLLYIFEKSKKIKIISLFFTVYVLVLVYPIFLSSTFFSTFPSKIVKIPDYYTELKNQLEQDTQTYKVLYLPINISYTAYDWGFAGADFIPNYIDKPNLHYTFQKEQSLFFNNFNNQFSKNPTSSTLDPYFKTLAENNVKYIVMRNDFNFNYYPDFGKAKQYTDELSHNTLIHKIKTLGALDLYQFNNTSPLFNSSATIFFQKINPTKYKIFLKGLKSDTKLTFAESFHPDWQLYLDKNPNNAGCQVINDTEKNISKECAGKEFGFDLGDIQYLWEKPQFDLSHYVANQYVNGWTIDPKYIIQNFDKSYYKLNPDGSVDIELTVYFKPQSYYYIGLIISCMTLLGCFGYFGWSFMKKRKRKDYPKDIYEIEHKK